MKGGQTMRAVLYLRVAAPARTESHSAAENQKEQLLELAREQGLEGWNTYGDIGFSGVTLKMLRISEEIATLIYANKLSCFT